MKLMKPEDCRKYIDMSAQQIRVGLQRKLLPWGVAINRKGNRWVYNIFPNKFFSYLGLPVPEEWQ